LLFSPKISGWQEAGKPGMVLRMGTRNRRLILILLAAAAGLVFFYSSRLNEPVYQGKSLTAWLAQFGTNHWSAGFHGDLDRQAEAAIQQIGTNAVPFYLQLMTTRESPIKVKWLALAPKPWLARFHIPGVFEYRNELYMRKCLGAWGFVALGAKAKPWVPALLALNSDKDQNTRYLAVFALRCLGPAAGEALPKMILLLKDPDLIIRGEAAMALGEIHQEPERSIPILMDFIEKYHADRSDWPPSYHAIRSLAKFGAQAKPAVPMLIGLLSDGEQAIREAATNALREIDPAAAAEAGVK
jgi:hypothetical protein